MRIMLNGEAREVNATMLADVLKECGYTQEHIATALNGDFVHKGARLETNVNEGDRLEVVAPISGG